MSYLILVRHGQSTWNALGKWTGVTDVELTDLGRAQARAAAKTLEGITFGSAHTSQLQRAHETLRIILSELNQTQLDAKRVAALNERSYGHLEGATKQASTAELGADRTHKIRRGWDEPTPGGETLKDVHARVVPYYLDHILTDLKAGKNVIVVSHGNTLRALVKHLESVNETDIEAVEIGNDEVYIYQIDEATGQIIAKNVHVSANLSE